ncbi:MAG: hypothetical protein IT383_23480 [Deltaproteobacteria bacterium]|nr:hypothetical protein [Deltaproteobacteria bacterium]
MTDTVWRDRREELGFGERQDGAPAEANAVLEMPDAEASHVVRVVLENGEAASFEVVAQRAVQAQRETSCTGEAMRGGGRDGGHRELRSGRTASSPELIAAGARHVR